MPGLLGRLGAGWCYALAGVRCREKPSLLGLRNLSIFPHRSGVDHHLADGS
jgi:hypothetical protein